MSARLIDQPAAQSIGIQEAMMFVCLSFQLQQRQMLPH